MANLPAGHVVTADEFNQSTGTFAAKPANGTTISDTTLDADPDLTVALAASATYAYYLEGAYASSAVADLKTLLSGPSGWAGRGTIWGSAVPSGATGNFDLTSTIIWDGLGVSTGAYMRIVGRITTSSTPGNLTLTWSQNTSDATTTTLYGGSQMWVVRIA